MLPSKLLLLIVASSIWSSSLLASELFFKWKYNTFLSKTNKNNHESSNKCAGGCPYKYPDVPRLGISFSTPGFEWKCKIESEDNMFKGLATGRDNIYRESRSFKCIHEKSRSAIEEILSCEINRKSNSLGQDKRLGNHFEKIVVSQTVGDINFSFDITLYCN